ncbi:hypothetical protein V8F06_003194 [Rhypophila decipiens]
MARHWHLGRTGAVLSVLGASASWPDKLHCGKGRCCSSYYQRTAAVTCCSLCIGLVCYGVSFSHLRFLRLSHHQWCSQEMPCCC